MSSITDSLALVGVPSAPFAPPRAGLLRDQELLDGQRAIAEARRRLDTIAATVAGEIAHRSRRELGHDGLAQSNGQRTAEGLISQLTGGSTREAKKICVGCEVRAECLSYALANDERFGIWGGLSERERRRLKRMAG